MTALQMMRLAVGQHQLAASDRAGDEKGARFDAVGDNGMRGAVKLFHALHADRGRAGAFDLRAHLHEQVGKIGNFRFERAIFEDGFAFGEHRCGENVFRAGDGDFREAERGAAQPVGLALRRIRDRR